MHGPFHLGDGEGQNPVLITLWISQVSYLIFIPVFYVLIKTIKGITIFLSTLEIKLCSKHFNTQETDAGFVGANRCCQMREVKSELLPATEQSIFNS